MIADSRASCRGNTSSSGGRVEPRVVILDASDERCVEVLELPRGATLGTSFCHRGTSWRVIAMRTHERVLIAEPA